MCVVLLFVREVFLYFQGGVGVIFWVRIFFSLGYFWEEEEESCELLVVKVYSSQETSVLVLVKEMGVEVIVFFKWFIIMYNIMVNNFIYKFLGVFLIIVQDKFFGVI